ncbi:MAG: TraR/DksA family transcriptional regulator [Kiritimatiellia bacterium]|jgi:RNA polymerase-binding transcription factor DksA|nr:TraR/DksA family transcriptional regulator [Kiritimatiellia bacterium]MDP6847523.1 TraR/DksA family transcriptional regulator [Kiritimatiellia bacterium]
MPTDADRSSTGSDNVNASGGNGHLSPEEISVFRAQLLSLRASATGNFSFLTKDSLKPVRPDDEDENSFDHDFALSVAGNEQDLIREIDEAIIRIESNTYGICEMTGKTIPKARLKALPHARYTVEAQSEQERGRFRPRRPS